MRCLIPHLLAYAVKQYLVPDICELVFRATSNGNPGEEIGRVEVIDVETRKVLNFNASRASLSEPRVLYQGRGELELERIEIRLIKPGK